MSDKPTEPTAHDLLITLSGLAGEGNIDTQLYGNLCSALLDLETFRGSGIEFNQLDQYRASVIPMFIDDGEVTICTSMSGGADEHHGMPKELTLLRTLGGGAGQRMARYRHTGLTDEVTGVTSVECEMVGKPE